MYGYNVGLLEYLPTVLFTMGYIQNNLAQVIFNQYSFAHSPPDRNLPGLELPVRPEAAQRAAGNHRSRVTPGGSASCGHRCRRGRHDLRQGALRSCAREGRGRLPGRALPQAAERPRPPHRP